MIRSRLCSALVTMTMLMTGCLALTASATVHDPARAHSLVDRPTGRPGPIMVVGDSITEGGPGTYTWRYFLYQHLAQHHGDGDFFVGPSRTPNDGTTDAYAVPTGWDQDHAARNGRMLDCYLDGRLRSAPCEPRRTAEEDLRNHQPATVVLMLGANDALLAWGQSTPADFEQNVRRYIDVAREVDPAIQVVLVGTTPIASTDEMVSATHHALLEAVADVAATMTSERSPVTFTDASVGYDPLVHHHDGVHPNSLGDHRIAGAVAEGLGHLGIGGAYGVQPEWEHEQIA